MFILDVKDGFSSRDVTLAAPAALHEMRFAVVFVGNVHPQASKCCEGFRTLLAGVDVFVGSDVVRVVVIF